MFCEVLLRWLLLLDISFLITPLRIQGGWLLWYFCVQKFMLMWHVCTCKSFNALTINMGGRPLCPKLNSIQSTLCSSNFKISPHEDVCEAKGNLCEEMVHYICCYTFCSLECHFMGSWTQHHSSLHCPWIAFSKGWKHWMNNNSGGRSTYRCSSLYM